MDVIPHMRLAAALACLWLTAPALAAGGCALAPGRAGVVLEHGGDCLDGLVHGVADVMIELPPAADGRTRRAREFGWFQHGVPQGAHVAVLTDPHAQAPGFAMLMSFDASGTNNWSFGLASSQWPRSGSLLSSGPWEDLDGKARQAGIDYSAAKRPDGTVYGEGLTMIADVIHQAVEFSMVNNVQSVNPATLRKFLASVSIKHPLSGVSTGFSADTIFTDGNGAPPPAHLAQNTRGTDATLQAGEILVRTREGCGLITQLSDEKYRQVIIDASLRKSWLGECVDGMVLGPGTMLVRSSDERISLIQHLWYFDGRPIGESTTTSFSSGAFTGGTTDGFSWKGSSFSRSRSATDSPVAQPAVSNPPMAMEFSPQRKVIYTLLRAKDGWSTECGPDGSTCLQERSLNSTPSTVSHYRCKQNDCTALWAEKVLPVIAAHDAFKASHEAEIEAVQQSVQPILAPLLTAGKVASRDAEVARIIGDAQSAHATERATAAADAERARVAAAQAKAAEAAARTESRKSLWNNVLSGVSVIAGAALTYAEASERPARQPTATTTTRPQAAISETDALIASLKDHAVPECVEYRGNRFFNVCNVDIEITFCIRNPTPFDKAPLTDAGAAYDCAKDQYGLWTIPAGKAMTGTFTGERANYSACRRPYAPVKIKGIPGGADHYGCR